MNKKKETSFLVAIMPIILMCFIMGIGFGIYRYSIEVLLLISACVAGIIAFACKATNWNDIMNEISSKIAKSFGPISIMIIVGLLIGTFMISGAIPMLVYFGLKTLSPSLFLVTAFIITMIVSVATGTSFGSVGTIGVALMGIAVGLNINLAAVAGAVVSGSYFGDKMSPLSDTTNLSPIAAGSDLYEHIHHMLYTTIPSSVLCLIVYFIAGRTNIVSSGTDTQSVTLICNQLSSIFNFNILLLTPFLIVIIGSIMKKPTIPIMILASFISCILAIFIQHYSFANIISACYNGYTVSMSGLDENSFSSNIITLLERGGMYSMMATILKVLCSFAFAGIMSASGFMDVILKKAKSMIKSDGTLILITVICGIVLTVIIGNAYVPILMVGEMFREAYKERSLLSKNLSRTLEDSVTVIVPLVPWSAGGAYMTSALGVPTLSYFPWAILCYTCAVFAIIYGFTGIGIAKENSDYTLINQKIA